jgi:ADP-dependent NAD(P)H-hydrate dehydratase / NAD(P)H-hydrate epimerase
MAARAALRSGAGLVTVAAIQSVCDAVAHHLPEVLFLPLPETDGAVAAEGAELILEAQHRHHSAVFGPGLSQGLSVLEFLSRVFDKLELPAVIDADALNAVSQGVLLPKGDCVLTPHPGEMSRLLESSVAEIQADRFHAVAAAIAKYGRAVLLKGPYSIVGDPDQPMVVNQTGNPGMASGGMGDVLSGVIATLLAEELPGYYAGACGMYWHGYAGDLAAESIGCIGYTAMEVADRLPAARAKITELCDGC